MEMLLTGELIDARNARWSGAWSTRWSPRGRSMPRVARAGEEARAKSRQPPSPPASAPSTSRWILDLAQAYELAAGVIASSFAHEEGRDGMDAFIEKRPPPKHE